MFAWLNISEHPILWHLHPFVLIMYSIECCLFPFQFFPELFRCSFSGHHLFLFLSTGWSPFAGEGVSVTKYHVTCYRSIYLA